MKKGRNSFWAKLLIWLLIGGSVLGVFVGLIYSII